MIVNKLSDDRDEGRKLSQRSTWILVPNFKARGGVLRRTCSRWLLGKAQGHGVGSVTGSPSFAKSAIGRDTLDGVGHPPSRAQFVDQQALSVRLDMDLGSNMG